jgi:hypothetical protein
MHRGPARTVGRSSEPGYVQVVTAHMSHRHRVPLAVLHLDLAGIRKARRFLDGQGIHVGAQHHDRTIAVAEQADRARSLVPFDRWTEPDQRTSNRPTEMDETFCGSRLTRRSRFEYSRHGMNTPQRILHAIPSSLMSTLYPSMNSGNVKPKKHGKGPGRRGLREGEQSRQTGHTVWIRPRSRWTRKLKARWRSLPSTDHCLRSLEPHQRHRRR